MILPLDGSLLSCDYIIIGFAEMLVSEDYPVSGTWGRKGRIKNQVTA